MSKLLSDEQVREAFESCEFVTKYHYPLSKGKFNDYKDADTSRLFNGFKAAFYLLMPIIERQNEALNYYGNRMGMGGTARQAIQETKQMLEQLGEKK